MVRAVSILLTTFDTLAKLALVTLLLDVAGNVVARTIFSATGGAVNLMISGAIEIASIALTILVFASLPRSAAFGGIKVDIFTSFLPKKAISFLDGFFAVLMAVFGFGMAYRFFSSTLEVYERGDATQDLEVPLYFIYGSITIACLALGIGVVFSLRSIIASDHFVAPE